MLLGQMLGAAVYAGLALTTTVPLLALLLGLLGVHVAVSYANSIFHGAVGSRERTRRMAIHESMLALGLVAGSALGGTVYQVRGLAAAYLLCLVVVLVGVLAQVRSIARGTRAARVMAAAPGQRCA